MPTTSTIISTAKDGTSSSISRIQEKALRHNPGREETRVATIPFLLPRSITTLHLQTEATSLGRGLRSRFPHSFSHSGWTSWSSGTTQNERSGWLKASRRSLPDLLSAWSASEVLGQVAVRFPLVLCVGKAS